MVTRLAAESPAMSCRPAREQALALKAAHAAEVARLEQRRAVDLERHPAEKEHVATREFEEHRVSLAAQEDEFAQALDGEREKQATIATAEAAALAQADAEATKAAESAAEGASAARKTAVAKLQRFVSEIEAEHARMHQAAGQTAEERRRDFRVG